MTFSKAAADLGVHTWLLAPRVGGLQLCTIYSALKMYSKTNVGMKMNNSSLK